MELYLMLTVLDRVRQKRLETLLNREKFPVILAMPARGTASRNVLLSYGLEATEKALVLTVADSEQARLLFRKAKQEMMIDIPGNGIMMAIPVKSIGGTKALEVLTGSEEMRKETPAMTFGHELIVVIANNGFTDEVMDTARAAGARGGTVVHAKGTGTAYAKKFLGLSLAEEKEMIFIVAAVSAKKDIMKAIAEKTGPGTPPGAVCLSLPVSEVAGLRNFSE